MKKYLGQHFLKNKSAIKKIIAALDLRAGETVIEIGPGKGALTFPLLDECDRIGAKLIAVEKDRELALEFYKKYSENKNIEIINDDALKIIPELTKSSKLTAKSCKFVGNIPFYITGKLLRTISELENKPRLTVLMIQKEVAERACAKQGELNLLAAATQIWAEPKILFTLPPEDFDPPPKVHSAVIRLTTKSKNSKLTAKSYYDLIHLIFKQPRKTLYNNLRDNLGLPAENIKKVLDDMKIDLKSRPQDLSIEQILDLSEKLNK